MDYLTLINLDLMGLFIIVVLVVALGMAWKEKRQERKQRAMKADVLRRLEALEKTINDASVEGRFQALETIVTDNRESLRRKIEAL